MEFERFRRAIRGVVLACLPVAGLLGATDRADAFNTRLIFYDQVAVGTCYVNTVIDYRFSQVYVGWPVGARAGGSYFDGGVITAATPISTANLNACGISNVTDLKQNGADGTLAGDDYIGFSFKGTQNGVTYAYEIAFSGATDTQWVSKKVRQNSAPVAALSVVGQAVAGGTVTVTAKDSTDADSDPLTYKWSVDGGAFVSGGDTLTFSAPDLNWNDAPKTVTVAVIATDGTAESQPKSLTLSFDPPARAPLLAVASASVPTARAGSRVSLSAEGSGGGGGTLYYEWSVVSGPLRSERDLGSRFEQAAWFNAPQVAADTVITLRLTVTQKTAGVPDRVATQTVDVTVTPNAAPTLTLADMTVAPGESVSLVASGQDADDPTLSYVWDWPSEVQSTVGGEETPTLTFVAPQVAVSDPDLVLPFTAYVSDGVTTVEKSVTVTVVPDRNTAPVAQAKLVGDAVQGALVQLSGSDSSDADGDDLTYLWEQTGGTSVMLTGGNTATPSFTAPEMAWSDAAVTYAFRLTVSDAEESSTATLTFTIDPPPRQIVANVSTSGGTTVRSGEQVYLTATVQESVGEVSYSWTASNAAVTLIGASSGAPSFTVPQVTEATPVKISLAVTEAGADGTLEADASLDLVMMPNTAPVVRGSAPARVTEGDEVRLDGTEAFDGEDDALSVGWRQEDGPLVKLGRCGASESDSAGPAATVAKPDPGPLACFLAPEVPEGRDSYQMVFRLVASDGVATASESFIITVTRTGLGAEQAGAQVQKFASQRINGLIANQPALDGVLDGGGDGSANLTVSSMGGDVDVGTAPSPDQPFWFRLRGSWTTVAGAESDYILGAAGTHVKLGDRLAIGVMGQVDHQKTVDGVSRSEGTGWLVGPYVVAKLPDHPLTLQGRLLSGRTVNAFSPAGSFVDHADGSRLLAQLGLSGQVKRGEMTWKPSLQAAYAQEDIEAYTDSLGAAIAGQTNAQAQVAAGVETTFPLAVASGSMNATLGVTDIWSGRLDGAEIAAPGHRGRISVAVNRAFGPGTQLTVTGSYDGIGQRDFKSTSLDLLFQHRF